jgi:O-antigen ligase
MIGPNVLGTLRPNPRGRRLAFPDTPGLWLAAVAGLCLAAAVGALASYGAVHEPRVALLGGGAILAGSLLALGDRLPRLFLAANGVLLLGYAFLGRGFAYLGAEPVYVGEVVLALAGLTILVGLHRLRIGAIEALLIAFMALGGLRTLPYIGQYGVDALRDAVLWGYGLIALAILVGMQKISRVDTVVRQYGRYLVPFLLWVPLITVIDLAAPNLIPLGPSSGVSLVQLKGGDVGVHLAGIGAFVILGLYSVRPGVSLSEWLFWAAWLGGLAVAALTRGGLVAASLGTVLALSLRPSARVVPLAILLVVALLLADLLNFSLETGRPREISADQLFRNVRSIVTDDDPSLQGTKDFRLEWWGKIVSYTFDGPYFWTGKGFGVNLADSDGFQLFEDRSLRAPHNSHLTVLARMGVPGLVLWTALQVAFAAALLRAFLRSRRLGNHGWAAIDGWLLAYWLAMTVNTAFDPYLEGPQGGIWFWSVFGFGLYALRAQETDAGLTPRQQREPLPALPARPREADLGAW